MRLPGAYGRRHAISAVSKISQSTPIGCTQISQRRASTASGTTAMRSACGPRCTDRAIGRAFIGWLKRPKRSNTEFARMSIASPGRKPARSDAPPGSTESTPIWYGCGAVVNVAPHNPYHGLAPPAPVVPRIAAIENSAHRPHVARMIARQVEGFMTPYSARAALRFPKTYTSTPLPTISAVRPEHLDHRKRFVRLVVGRKAPRGSPRRASS